MNFTYTEIIDIDTLAVAQKAFVGDFLSKVPRYFISHS